MVRLIKVILIISLLTSCREAQVPRPRGYFRIDFPEKEYRSYNSDCPFTFEFPVYGKIDIDEYATEPCWFNILFDGYKGALHLSYKKIGGDLNLLVEDTHKLAYKHTVKADAIEEKIWDNSQDKVYGVVYTIEGNAASSMQFYLTDSVQNFIRGALYFSVQPEKDSLAPVIDFFREDVIHLIETFRWNDN